MPPSHATPTFAPRRFETVRVLGSGGMGVVYEAIDRERRSRVALKTLRRSEADFVRRFKNEFRSLQDINHPNLVSLGELLEEDGQLFFTMELLHGETLLAYVRGDGLELGDTSTRSAEAASGEQEIDPADHDHVWLPTELGARGTPKVREPPRFDEAKLRSALGQLALGIEALHAAQRVHRDLKPSNILVTAEGRVVILDFGLIANVERDPHDTHVVGTAHFMAPEQAAGRAVGPEADWYSVGVVLYLALTGRYPLQVSAKAVLSCKQYVEPSPPSHLVEGLPPDLEALAIDLLRIDPIERPGGAEILRRLSVEQPASEPERKVHAPSFVGRGAELDVLARALAEVRAGAAATVLVEGESGMGKSALVRRFVERLDDDAVVLSGRCYEREAVTYKALDELIEHLARHLARLPDDQAAALLPPDAALLASVFPDLQSVRAVRAAPPLPRDAMDPREVRALVFAALRELLSRLAATAPLVITIDDLQWADADGLALLAHATRPPNAPALLLVATVRSGGADGLPSAAKALLAQGAARRVQLDRLPDDDARRLAEELVRASRGSGPRSAIDVGGLVAEARGHPLFLDALVRHRLVQAGGEPIRLEDALWARVTQLDAPARRLVEIAAIAGGPLAQGVAADAARVDLDELVKIAAVLRAGNLVRTTRRAEPDDEGARPSSPSLSPAADTIEPYHDRVRQTVLSHLDEGAARAWHRRLAAALEATEGAELEQLAVHWRDAGERDAASRYAALAADQAAAQLAFDRAARLYKMARELSTRGPGPEERALYGKLADALSDAGSSAAAASAYLAASRGAEPRDALEKKRRAAESFLRSGYVDEGLSCLRDVLGAVGMDLPQRPREVLAGFLYRRAELRLRGLDFEERTASEIPATALAQIDACWSAALGLGMIDAVRGGHFQTRNLLLSLEAGDPYRVARALALEVSFVATAGGASTSRVAELLPRAEAIARRAGHPHALGLLEMSRGLSLFFVGRYKESLATLDHAEVTLREHCTGAAWERATAISHAIWDLYCLGDLREFSRRIQRHLREAEERGDRLWAANLRSNISNTCWLIKDDPARAEREAEEAMRSWSNAGFHLQHLFDLLARGQLHLYRGSAETGHRLLMDRWSALERSSALRVQFARILMLHLRARTSLATARASGDRRARLALALRDATALDRERMAWSAPLAELVRAGAARIRGDRDAAAAHLATSIRGFEAADLAFFAWTARRRLGELEGGEGGRARVNAARRWMTEQGIVDPDAMTAMMAPGFPD